MPIWIALVLGVVEGLTEFIPVSSTGHLILASGPLRFSGPVADAFNVFIQSGAILAVVALYPRRFKDLFVGGGGARGLTGLPGLVKLGVASIPALIFGFLLQDFIKGALFDPLVVAPALILGGIVLVAIENVERRARVQSFAELSYRDCLLLGVFQCAALWPGISRSGSTIVGGRLLGFAPRFAAEFSFILAVPVILAAALYDLLLHWDKISAGLLPFFAAGFVVSFAVAFYSMKFFLDLLERYSLKPFGYYRILLGAVILLLYLEN